MGCVFVDYYRYICIYWFWYGLVVFYVYEVVIYIELFGFDILFGEFDCFFE